MYHDTTIHDWQLKKISVPLVQHIAVQKVPLAESNAMANLWTLVSHWETIQLLRSRVHQSLHMAGATQSDICKMEFFCESHKFVLLH